MHDEYGRHRDRDPTPFRPRGSRPVSTRRPWSSTAALDANVGRLQGELDRARYRAPAPREDPQERALGRLQLAGGARGLTVGTLGEAEVFASGGLTDLFLAYPVWADGPKVDRLRALCASPPDLRVGVDTVEGADSWPRGRRRCHGRSGSSSRWIRGMHRTGVTSPSEAARVRGRRSRGRSRRHRRLPHGGHGYRPGGAAAAGLDEITSLEAAADALEAAGSRRRSSVPVRRPRCSPRRPAA